MSIPPASLRLSSSAPVLRSPFLCLKEPFPTPSWTLKVDEHRGSVSAVEKVVAAHVAVRYPMVAHWPHFDLRCTKSEVSAGQRLGSISFAKPVTLQISRVRPQNLGSLFGGYRCSRTATLALTHRISQKKRASFVLTTWCDSRVSRYYMAAS